MSDPLLSFSVLPVPVAEVAPGPHSEAYFADQSEKKRAFVEIRDQRQHRPAWNTLKEVFWTPCTSFFQLGQSVGSFAGHLLFALPAALVGGIIGVTVYAPVMKTIDYLSGNCHGRSLRQYAIKPAQVLANMVYNRVTDVFCRYLLGPSLLTAVVEPLHFIAAGLVVAVTASPFIYRDFASNSARTVEDYIDCPLSTSVKHFINHHFWQRLDDVANARNIQSQPLPHMKSIFDQIRKCSSEEHLQLAVANGQLNADDIPYFALD